MKLFKLRRLIAVLLTALFVTSGSAVATQSAASAAPQGTVRLYRLWSPSATDHFYTTNRSERDNAVQRLGYQDEGTAAWIYPSDRRNTVPLYRLWNPSVTDHFYTTDRNERNRAITS